MSNVKAESLAIDAFESAVAASLAAAADRNHGRMIASRNSHESTSVCRRQVVDVSGRAGGGVNLVTDIRRKRTEANMITSPAWMLEGRTFAAATGAACGSPQFVTRYIRPPPDDGDGASKRCVMLAALAPQPHPGCRSL